MTINLRTFAAAIITAVTLLGTAAFADDTVLLTVTGPDGAEVKSYDLAALEALGATSFDTTTIWTEGMQTFTGVSLVTLFKDIGATEGSVNAIAINNYSAPIPVTDAVEDGPILAYLANGKPMSVRDKGPLWVVYPYDSKADYQSETIYSRSIWQLDRLQLSK